MARRSKNRLFNNKKELENEDFQRKIDDKEEVNDIIIACEDSVSSPAYFQEIVNKLIKNRVITQDSFVIVPHNGHTNPLAILENLKSYENKYGKKYNDFKHKWIVIDRDKGAHTEKQFNDAINLARSTKIENHVEVAYANDSFELWYLLHFTAQSEFIHRKNINAKLLRIIKKIDSRFKGLNKKKLKQQQYISIIFNKILPYQEKAIQNAKELLESYGTSHNPEKDNPSTTIHKLVELLNGLCR